MTDSRILKIGVEVTSIEIIMTRRKSRKRKSLYLNAVKIYLYKSNANFFVKNSQKTSRDGGG